MIIRNMQQYLPLLTQYTELRSQENRVMNIACLKGNFVQNAKNSTGDPSARVYRNGLGRADTDASSSEKNTSL